MSSSPASTNRVALAVTAVIAALATASGIAIIDGAEHVLLAAPKVLYVELFVPAIAVTAIVDLIRRAPDRGAHYRAPLGAVGLLALAWYRNVVVSDWRLVLAVVLYVLVILVAVVDRVRPRPHT
jgi:hypothetical protein